jgi:hypothetical protein
MKDATFGRAARSPDFPLSNVGRSALYFKDDKPDRLADSPIFFTLFH